MSSFLFFICTIAASDDNDSGDDAKFEHFGLMEFGHLFRGELFDDEGVSDRAYWLGFSVDPNKSRLVQFVGVIVVSSEAHLGLAISVGVVVVVVVSDCDHFIVSIFIVETKLTPVPFEIAEIVCGYAYLRVRGCKPKCSIAWRSLLVETDM